MFSFAKIPTENFEETQKRQVKLIGREWIYRIFLKPHICMFSHAPMKRKKIKTASIY